ncbi:sodium:solute symporter family protein [Fuchsiella alkaliacetigena]|uniref:sodium:solute symporter family protein n=1 Tax=Fuchsiella alkaliacetigena TaxID=957042 RepID=UPI00200AE995|nr:sodium:solute symporter family protein [Fuchsiella alkaliacetigena]MCK8825673.1 sodium:solute symporter family protein [Fuchsiella alkaliacetigena]
MLSIGHLTGMLILLLGVLIISVFSIKKVDSISEFIVGSQEVGAGIVMGTILGTLIGGTSTIATVQLAYQSGLSGIAFTLGAGLGCIILGLFFTKTLREAEVETGPQFLVKAFGSKAGPLSSLFISLGTLINIIGNTLAAVALLTSVFGLAPALAVVLTGGLIIAYVFFGGIQGLGLMGIVKSILVYLVMLLAGMTALRSAGGLAGLGLSLELQSLVQLFERGISNDLLAVGAVIVGVLSTQTYLQAVFMGKDVRTSRVGTITSGLLMIPLGLIGTSVGLYMQLNYPGIDSSQALPIFILEYFSPVLAGVILATLLIMVIITGAGLTLGVSTIFSRDIYGKLINPGATDKESIKVSRLAILAIVGFSSLFTLGNVGTVIMEWSYLSMALRGAAMFLPFLGAVFFNQEISQRAGVLTIAIAPSMSLLWAIFSPVQLDPLYIGLLIGLIILGSSFLNSKYKYSLSEN